MLNPTFSVQNLLIMVSKLLAKHNIKIIFKLRGELSVQRAWGKDKSSLQFLGVCLVPFIGKIKRSMSTRVGYNEWSTRLLNVTSLDVRAHHMVQQFNFKDTKVLVTIEIHIILHQPWNTLFYPVIQAQRLTPSNILNPI